MTGLDGQSVAGARTVEPGQDDRWLDDTAIRVGLFVGIPSLAGLGSRMEFWELPNALEYLGLALMLMVIVRSLRTTPDYLLAAMIVFIPFSRVVDISPLPGLNIMNVLILLGLMAASQRNREHSANDNPDPNARLMKWWAALSLLSLVTAMVRMGFDFIFPDHLTLLKGWLDQFFIYFIFSSIVRDRRLTMRVVVYTMIASALVLVWGVDEWLSKMDRRSMEESSVMGPQLERNDVSAFFVSTSGMFLAILLHYTYRLRSWLVMPYLYLMARVLVATFSRGAYLGIAMAAVTATYVRGRKFAFMVALLLMAAIAAFPELVPGSMKARMEQTQEADVMGTSLDSSAETRLILWRAAGEMILESPIFGKGFSTFRYLKGQYTEVDVPESDNHNMYLYIASQMGIPALLVFVLIVVRLYRQGAALYRESPDANTRLIGLGIASMAGGVAMVNMFGSRMVDVAVMGYMWIYFAIVSRLWQAHRLTLAGRTSR
jgi:putative inorganic carbon (HCO3(-)) transporter